MGNFRLLATALIYLALLGPAFGQEAARLYDAKGNPLESSTSDPAPTARGLIVRPAGTQSVTATDLDIRNLNKAQDETYSVLRTDAGVAYDARNRNWTITEGLTISTFPDNEPFNLNQIVGAAPSATNPLPARLSNGTVFIDPRDRNWTITETVTVTGPLTDAQLRTTPVSVSGPLTDAQLRATPVPVSRGVISATMNNDGACPSGAANFTVLASNASRKKAYLWASSANTDDVFLKFGATATTSDARLSPGQPINEINDPVYTGQIDAIPNSGTQAVCVMEFN